MHPFWYQDTIISIISINFWLNKHTFLKALLPTRSRLVLKAMLGPYTLDN